MYSDFSVWLVVAAADMQVSCSVAVCLYEADQEEVFGYNVTQACQRTCLIWSRYALFCEAIHSITPMTRGAIMLQGYERRLCTFVTR